ncbi:MAG: redoxin domain-containing protein [Tetragenococcus koreensis]|nr:redoxin domain-containing protein [Tetragenococcus koreensis]
MEVKFKGEPLEVKGKQPNLGDKAPDAKLTTRQDEEVMLSSYFGDEIVVLSVVPDVLTRTCELQTKRFSEELAGKDVKYLTISRNTVDEFNNWNKENDLDLSTLSDTHDEFGEAYGLEINLGGDERLTRSVFLVDKEGEIQYKQMVEEVSNEPDYDDVLKAIDQI